MTITIELTNAEEKALKTVMADPQDWAENFVKVRAHNEILTIYQRELERLRREGAKSIPLDMHEVVLSTEMVDASAATIAFMKEQLENAKLSSEAPGVSTIP